METKTEERFESWAIVDLFGHLQLAGLVTEATIGGCSFLRVDVPAIGEQPPHTRYFGQGAIYSLTPVSEEIARSALQYIRPRPVQAYMLPQPKPMSDEDIEGYRDADAREDDRDWGGNDDDDDDNPF